MRRIPKLSFRRVKSRLNPARRAVHMTAKRMRTLGRGARKTMNNMGVGQMKALFILPVLLALIVAAAYWGVPQRQTVRFLPTADMQPNPLMGLCLSARDDAEVEVSTNLVWVQVTWAELEPEQGQYAFDAFDKQIHLSHWQEQDARLVFRLMLDVPDKQALPAWLLPEEDELDFLPVPDYSDPFLQEKHFQLLGEIEQRYGAMLAYVEVGSLGANGTWVGSEESPMPLTDVTSIYLWQYATAFPEQKLLAPAQYREATLYAMGNYLPDLADADASWEWLNRLRFGGFDTETGTRLRPDDVTGTQVPSAAWLIGDVSIDSPLLRRLQDVKATYLCIRSAMLANADSLLANVGYRYWIRQAQWNRSIRPDYSLYVDLTVQNDGVTALMHDSALWLALVDADGTIVYREKTEETPAQWLPGAADCRVRLTVPYFLPAGEYTLAAGICLANSAEPTVGFAMHCQRSGLWALLGEVTVQ